MAPPLPRKLPWNWIQSGKTEEFENRSGYEYGTVPDRRGTIHTESGRERGKFRIPNAIAMSHAVNCPNYIFMVEHPIPALLVFISVYSMLTQILTH